MTTSVQVGLAPELRGTMTGAAVAIGTLLFPPAIIIFDNQGTVPVAISINGGTTTWKTFKSGQSLVLDLTANHGSPDTYSFPKGTIFTGTGASGDFSISYTYYKVNA